MGSIHPALTYRSAGQSTLGDALDLAVVADQALHVGVVALTDRARNEPRDLYDVW